MPVVRRSDPSAHNIAVLPADRVVAVFGRIARTRDCTKVPPPVCRHPAVALVRGHRTVAADNIHQVAVADSSHLAAVDNIPLAAAGNNPPAAVGNTAAVAPPPRQLNRPR